MNTEDSERRYAQIEGERDYFKRLADSRAKERDYQQGRIAEMEEREAALQKELDRHKRMFMRTCEQLGAVQEALGTDIVGIEAVMVREISQERDALAAHIEDVHRSINDLIGESEGVAGLHKNGDIAAWGDLLEGGHFEGWLLALGDKPDTTSLARRDKIKQAEAMEELYDQSALHKVINRGALINRARNLRRQAEELAHDES